MKDRTKFWFWLPVFVFLPIGLWFGLRGGSAPTGEKVVATANFPGGTEVEILRVEVAASMEVSSGRRAFFRKLFDTTSSRTWAGGYSFGDLKAHNEQGRWHRSVFEPHHRCLVLLAKAEGVPSDIFRDFQGKGSKVRFDPKTGVFDRMGNHHLPSAPNPRWSIDVSDGAGGWIECIGPLVANQSDGRAFFSAPYFPRDKAELQLRINRTGEGPILLTVSNPDHVVALPAWTGQPVELERTYSEFRVVADPQTDAINYNGSVFNELSANLRTFPLDDGQFRNSWKINELILEDEQGNLASWGRFRPLPNYQFVRVSGQIRRAARYVWPLKETTVIAELQMPDQLPTEVIDCTILPDGTSKGVDSLVITMKDGGPQPEWEFRIEGNGELAFIDTLQQEGLVIFQEGEDQSTGSRGFGNGGSWSGADGAGNSRFNLKVRWIGNLPLGKTIRIAVPDSFPAQSVEFVFPRKAFEGWRP